MLLPIGVGGNLSICLFTANHCQQEKTMTHLKKIQKFLQICSLFLSFIFVSPVDAHKTIGITQIVDHPSLNAIREGILAELSHKSYVEGKNLTVVFENAQGNPTIAAQIAQKFASLPLDAIIPITTPSAQTIVQQVKKTPVVFAAISDPIAAKIVSSLEHPGGNVTGLADIPPLEEQLDLIKSAIPELKTIGVVYNPGEINNVSFLQNLKVLGLRKHISIVTAASPKSADVRAAAQSLVGRVDAIFIGNDNTVVSGLEALVKVCLDAGKPLFASDPESVKRGALASYAYVQRDIGRQVGAMVAEVLNGKNPKDMPVEKPKSLKLSMNPATCEKLNINCDFSKNPQGE